MAENKKTVKVVIGNRVYPVVVSDTEQERIEQGVDLLNGYIEKMKSEFAVRDGQDLLAMTALYFVNKFLEKKEGSADVHTVDSELLQLCDEINKIIK